LRWITRPEKHSGPKKERERDTTDRTGARRRRRRGRADQAIFNI